jgi:hypothetical protein
MSDPVRYSLSGSLATIVMDDAKVNAMSPDLLRGLHAAVVLLTARQNIFFRGFRHEDSRQQELPSGFSRWYGSARNSRRAYCPFRIP